MKYTDALKIYNQGKSKWCFPRKGSKDHSKVLKIQGKSSVKVKNLVKKDPKKKNIKVNIHKSISKKPKSVSNKDIMPKNISKKPNVIPP